MSILHVPKTFIVLMAFAVAACGALSKLPEIDQAVAEEEAQKQREMAIEENEYNTSRAHRIGFKIFIANAELCQKTKFPMGARLAYWREQDDEFIDALKNVYGLKAHAKFIQVPQDSPAWKSGLRKGDEVVAIDGENVPSDGKKVFRWTTKKLSELTKAEKSYTITINRDSAEKIINAAPEKVCDFPIVVNKKDEVNAYADGERILLSVGMMRFTRNDNELALILGHELAHNTMLHVQKGSGNRMAGAVVGALIGALLGVNLTQAGADLGGAVNSQDFEAEADYVGLYYAARAGFDVSDVAKLWRRMAANHPAAIHLAGSTHPSTAKRFVAIEKTWEEIKSKKKTSH